MNGTTGAVPTRVLVLGMAHADGSLDATEVFGVAEACGLSADQVRSCLRRLVAEGLFRRDGSGRDATYEATDEGHRALAGFLERTRLAYAQDAAGRGWDRHWHVVAFAVPESQRAARDALRDRLLAFGGARVHDGFYVSPHRWDDDVRGEAERLGVADVLTLAATESLEVGGERDPRDLARRLWPLEELATRYGEFIDAHAHVPDLLEGMLDRRERIGDEQFLAGTLQATVAFQDVFNRDPLLPPELLPRPWPGRAARDLILRSRRLGLRVRHRADRPALFRAYDELIESIH